MVKRNHETEPAKKGKADKAKPEAKPAPAAAAAPVTKPVAKASEAQKRAIHNLSKRRGLSLEELEKLALEAYGTVLSELSTADASQMIRHLQQSA